VLANEQVVDGCCWRHESHEGGPARLGAVVSSASPPYAQELLDGLDKLDGWPEKVRTCNATGSGAAKGRTLNFLLEEINEGSGIRDQGSEKMRIRVFTTRVDTIFWRDQRATGAPARAGGPVHRRQSELKAQVDELLEQQKKAREAGKSGRDRKSTACRPGASPQSVQRRTDPLWVANYILADCGTPAPA